jgi:RHS repeat-associated protein
MYSTPDGVQFVIDEVLGLQSITDANGNKITFTHTGIIHSDGRSINYTRDSQDRITQINDLNGNPIKYSYTTAGDLDTFTDAVGNVTSFNYDTFGNHYLTKINDPSGHTPITNQYDANNRLISSTDANGHTITYTHQIDARTEQITDQLGKITVYQYDNDGNVLTQTDPLGNTTTFTYDSNDNQLTVTNALSQTTTDTYDAFNNKLSETDPLGNKTTYTYNSLNKVLTMTDPRGAVTAYTYDVKGNTLTSTDALGNTSTTSYYASGLVQKTVDAAGNTTSFVYDNNGNLTQQTDALGNLSTPIPGHITTYTYDANNNRLSQTVQQSMGGVLTNVITLYTYDKNNRLTVTNSAANLFGGVISTTNYNSIGKVMSSTDPLGHTTSYSYDPMGQLTQTSYADGTSESTTYDAEGHRATSTDRAGRITSFSYDDDGRLTKTTYTDQTSTSTSYDQLGRVTSTTDALGHTTTNVYDPGCGCSGRLTKVIDALGNATQFLYDADGNKVSVTDANNHTTLYSYDLNNRQTVIRYSDNTQQSTQYDVLGRRSAIIDQAGLKTIYDYDQLGRLMTVTDARNQKTSYSYDELGHQMTQTTFVNMQPRTTQYQYDGLGRRTQRTLPLGQSEMYAYDAAGNLFTHTNFNGGGTTFYYDSLNRLIKKQYTDGKIFTFTYTATGQRANVIDGSINDNTGTITYTYDNRDRLIQRQAQQVTEDYSYDAAGNLLSVSVSNDSGVLLKVLYGLDALNRLQTAENNSPGASANNITNYQYDKVGNVASVQLPNGIASNFQYNALNRLTNLNIVNTLNNNINIAGYSYTLGAAGNRLSVAEMGGRTVTYTYDELYRLTSEAIAGSTNANNNGTINYSYDEVGNRLQRNSLVGAVPEQQFSYDKNDRLMTDSYDSAGNTTQSGNRTFSYDIDGHLTDVSESTSGLAIHIIYDVDGNRISKTVGTKDINGNFTNQTTTYFIVDTNSTTGYSEILGELQSVNGSTPTLVTRYVYGLGPAPISQERLVNGAWVPSYYVMDGHGSVRLLTDANGNVTDSMDYDSFGNLINQVGTTPNNYLFAGEQWDPDLGFYYSRARFLNVQTSRFATMDLFEGNYKNPLSLNKYVYTNDNPVNYSDPTGLFTEFYSFSSMSSVLASIPVPQIQATVSSVQGAVALATAIPESITDVRNILTSNGLCHNFFNLFGFHFAYNGGQSNIGLAAFNNLATIFTPAPLNSYTIGIETAVNTSKNPVNDLYRFAVSSKVNTNGPFFQTNLFFPIGSNNRVNTPRIGSYPPATRRSRAIQMLHELAHLIWLGPDKQNDPIWLIPDDGVQNGSAQSEQNTEDIKHFCSSEIEMLPGN